MTRHRWASATWWCRGFPPALMLGFSNIPDDRTADAVEALRQAILEA